MNLLRKNEISITILWIVVGQLLMLGLSMAPYEQLTRNFAISYVGRILPTVASITETNVFNADLARVDLTIKILLSPLLSFLYFLIPEEKWMLRTRSNARHGWVVAIAFISSAVLLLKPINGGNVADFLCRSQIGFSFLSSVISGVIAILIRSIPSIFNTARNLTGN